MSRFGPALSLLLLLGSTGTAQTSEERIAELFHAGQQALQLGEFAQAADDFKKVLALDPTLLEAEVNLGLACQSLLDYDSAVLHLTKALRQRPNLPGPTLIVGMDYLKLGAPEKALPLLERALKANPSDRTAREALASAYMAQQDFRSAAEQFRQIALRDPDKPDAWFKLGHQYLDLSARLAYRGSHLYRDSAWGHRFLGDLLLQRSRSDDAAKEYAKALTIEPQQRGLHVSIGQAFLHAGKLTEAEAEFRREIQLEPQSQAAWLGLANIEAARKQPSAALDDIKKVWDISPEFLAVQRDFPSVELPPAAASADIPAMPPEPPSAARHFLLAGLYAAANQTPTADREWKSFQTAFSAWQRAANMPAGQDPCKTSGYSHCIETLAARTHLSDTERLLLGKMLFTLQQYEPAAEALAKVPGVSPENAEASYWLARTYLAEGGEAYAQLQESFPESWRTYQLRAEGSALRGDFDDALKQFHAALQLRPDEPELHEALGELYLDNNKSEEAQTELKNALAEDPARTHALYLLGLLYVQKKDNEKALPYLQSALRLQPDLAEANSLLGTVYVRLGQFADAVPRLEKAAPSDHYGNVHYQLFMAYRKLGRAELAQKELARSQDLRKRYLERDQALIMGSPAPEGEDRE